jgi:hypothetical protein
VDRTEQIKVYLSAERVIVDGTYRISNNLRWNATPTLLLVDSNGVVRRSYVGKLAPDQEEEVLNSVRRAAI